MAVCHVLRSRAARMPLAQRHHSLQALALDRKHEAFRKRVQIRTPRRQPRCSHATSSPDPSEYTGVERITIDEQIPLPNQEAVAPIHQSSRHLLHQLRDLTELPRPAWSPPRAAIVLLRHQFTVPAQDASPASRGSPPSPAPYAPSAHPARQVGDVRQPSAAASCCRVSRAGLGFRPSGRRPPAATPVRATPPVRPPETATAAEATPQWARPSSVSRRASYTFRRTPRAR